MPRHVAGELVAKFKTQGDRTSVAVAHADLFPFDFTKVELRGAVVSDKRTVLPVTDTEFSRARLADVYVVPHDGGPPFTATLERLEGWAVMVDDVRGSGSVRVGTFRARVVATIHEPPLAPPPPPEQPLPAPAYPVATVHPMGAPSAVDGDGQVRLATPTSGSLSSGWTATRRALDGDVANRAGCMPSLGTWLWEGCSTLVVGVVLGLLALALLSGFPSIFRWLNSIWVGLGLPTIQVERLPSVLQRLSHWLLTGGSTAAGVALGVALALFFLFRKRR